MRVGVLTGGGDCPGLNAAIRAITRRSIGLGHEVVGIRDSWLGLVRGDTVRLDRRSVAGILPRGGTILGMGRYDPFREPDGVEAVAAALVGERLDAVVAIGGEGTLGIAGRLVEERGLPIVGVPKTIDNDIAATDYTFGFDTAVQVCVDAIDRLHTTAESHNRIMVVEVMGRTTGWIAIQAGLASGADVILVPEDNVPVEAACEALRLRHANGKDFSIVVVAEGYRLAGPSGELSVVSQGRDAYGFERLGGVGRLLAMEIERRTGFETRVTVLGHVQRGGTPTARDRVLATRFGLAAALLVHEGRFGRMAALRGDRIVDVSLAEATRDVKRVPAELLEAARAVA